jgi:hypothetical protein
VLYTLMNKKMRPPLASLNTATMLMIRIELNNKNVCRITISYSAVASVKGMVMIVAIVAERLTRKLPSASFRTGFLVLFANIDISLLSTSSVMKHICNVIDNSSIHMLVFGLC